MIDYIDGLRLLCSRMRNPFPVIADRLRLKKEPYTVRLKNGITIELRPGLGDSYGFYEVLVRDNYTNWGQTISKGDTVIDVGANIGCFSILASRLVGPIGRVIAIEPEPSTHERLLKNIELNQATNIKPLRLALGEEEEMVDLYTNDNSLFSSTYSVVDGKSIDARHQKVQMITFESLMEREDVEVCNYLKLDCEGAEYSILGSISDTIAGKIKQMTIEVHRVAGHEPSEIQDILQGYGFSLVEGSSPQYYLRRG